MPKARRFLIAALLSVMALGAAALFWPRGDPVARYIGMTEQQLDAAMKNNPPYGRHFEEGWDAAWMLNDEDTFLELKWLLVRYENGKVVSAKILVD